MKNNTKLIEKIVSIYSGKTNINLIDIGARGGRQKHWSDVPEASINYFGFDADVVECERLNKNCRPSEKYFPFALSDSNQTLPLYLTKQLGCSSIYHPDHKITNRYYESEQWDIVNEIPLQTVRLDSVLEDNRIVPDFVKIDIQGAELDVLKGAGKYLDHVLGVESEVEFIPLYKGQPLFADIDSFMRSNGFELFDLNRYWAKRKTVKPSSIVRGQVIFGDAIYFRSLETFYDSCINEDDAKSRLLKMIIILSVYGHYDGALTYINHDKSPLDISERNILTRILVDHCRFKVNWLQNILFSNRISTTLGGLLLRIGWTLLYGLRVHGWGTDNNNNYPRRKL